MRLGWVLVVTLLAPVVSSVRADDWPQWRGPERNGISKESGWAFQWPDEGPKIAWKAKIGLGYSSFVVADGRAYTVGFANSQDTVFCFDANSTGLRIHERQFHANNYFRTRIGLKGRNSRLPGIP